MLNKDDYEEPRCLLNMHPDINPIPVGRVIDKLDSYLDQKDYPSAERHLRYWIAEAEASRDMRGKLTVLNELIGLYRKTGKEEECFQAISDALSLADSLNIGDTVSYGTTLINAATGYNAFGRADKALPLYYEARKNYESILDADDGRLGGLYNNMALALTELKEYREAEECFGRAMDVMKTQKNGELETAITLLNLADLYAAESGTEAAEKKIEQCLLKAEELMNTESLPRDGYYAFVCEKCAPVFGYYGFFAAERELNRRAGEYYERS